MPTIRAWRMHDYGGPEVLQLDRLPAPQAAAGEVVVQVACAGVNAIDWKYRSGLMRNVYPLTLPASLGAELAGMVVAAGADVVQFRPGDRVMGVIGRGAYAEQVAVDAKALCAIPAGLSDAEAASIPVAALTAWQLVHDAGALQPGQTVLIHGASGGVGNFAVQFAKQAGARVIAAASPANRDHLLRLGADQVIDRNAVSFENQVTGIDLVLDLVGGDLASRSWPVLASGGTLLSIAAPDLARHVPEGKRGRFYSMRNDPKQLAKIADDVANKVITTTVANHFAFEAYPTAIALNQHGHSPGKIVLNVASENQLPRTNF